MNNETIKTKSINDKLLVAEFFKGYGSQSMALDNLGISHEVVVGSEIDVDAIIAYASARFTQEELDKEINLSEDEIRQWLMDKNIGYDFKKGKSSIPRMKKSKLHKLYNACVITNEYGDISLLNPNELPDFDLMTYSFPCFVAGTLIMTDNGYKKIEDIQKGDMVLTHTNSYKSVVKPMKQKADKIYRIRNMGSEDLYVTEEHPFYVRKRKRVWDNSRRSYNRVFEGPKWVETKDLTKDTYLGIAINQESKLPEWGGVVFEWKDGRKDRHSNVLNDCFDKYDFWWIIGRYLGDGWFRHQGGIIICSAFDKTHEIHEKLNSLGWGYSTVKERTVDKVHIPFKEIGEYCEQFGRGASNKHLTGDVFNLPKELLKGFLDGYMSADGCYTGGLWKASSVSRELIYGIGQCVAKVYNRPFSIGLCKRNKTHIIEGRVVNQKDSYHIAWKTESGKQDKAFYEDGYIWCPISDIEILKHNDFVYNMEVEEDNSYTANGIIAHNCTDISVAGNQQGFVKGSGTRSGLLWECEKIIKVKKPKYLLMENVKNLVSKKFKPDFDKWCEWLEEQGYINYWKVLNSKDYGVPQNRERVFMISILGEHEPYTFPEKQDPVLKLKDILEDIVDEKYYIDSEKTQKIIEQLKNKESLLLDMSQSKREGNPREHTDCAPTLNSRDYKEPRLINEKPNITVMACLTPDRVEKRQNGRRFKEDGEPMFTITTQDRHGIVQIGNYRENEKGFSNPQTGRVYSSEGVSPTLNTMQGGDRQPKVLCIDDTVGFDGVRTYEEYSPTLRSERSGLKTITNYRIRKLTPRECFRLMGVSDELFDKISESGISNSGLYKLAGNSIVVDVLEYIFANLFNVDSQKNNKRIGGCVKEKPVLVGGIGEKTLENNIDRIIECIALKQ